MPPAMQAMESESPLLVDAQASASGPVRVAAASSSVVARSATSSARATALADSHPSPIPAQGSPNSAGGRVRRLFESARGGGEDVCGPVVQPFYQV